MVAFIAVVLGMAGCGGGGDESSKPATTPITEPTTMPVTEPATTTVTDPATTTVTEPATTTVTDPATTPVTEPVPVPVPVTEPVNTVFNIAKVARNGMIVTLTSASISSTGVNNEYTFKYTQKNETSGTLDEVRMKFYFTDGTSLPQEGSFGTLVPGETKSRTYTFTALSTKDPSILEFDHDNASALIPVPGSIQIPW